MVCSNLLMDSATRRDQQATCSRKKFTKEVIRAIETLELRRSNLSDEELAESAWQKLQFDLPVVEARELAALVDRLRSSLQGKVGWPCYSLTSKALENITNGAKRGSCYKPELPEHEQQLQQLLSDAISASVRPQTPQNSTSQQQHQASLVNSSPGSVADPQQEHTLQDRYQQLCAVVLLQYVGKVVSLSEQDGWQLLQDYQPEDDAASHLLAHQPSRQQAEAGQLPHCSGQLTDQELLDALLQQGQPLTTTIEPVPAQSGPSLITTQHPATDSAAPAEVTSTFRQPDAAAQDLDGDEPYEPLEPIQPGNDSFCSTSQRQASAQQQPYSWPSLQHKLLSISGHVQYKVLSCEYLWQQQAAAQHVLQLLRAVGVHNHAVELQPLVHAYAGLLIDRIAVHPGDLPLLQQLWESLGLTGQGLLSNGVEHRRSRPGLSPSRHSQVRGLPAEAVLGLTAAASVWHQVTGSNSRSKLWRLMYENLPQLLEQCTEQLAYSSGGSKRSSHYTVEQPNVGVADTNGIVTHLQQQNQGSQGDQLVHVGVVSHIIELLVLGRPTSIDVAGQLTQMGVTRNLVQLFNKHGTDASAEALRRALLLSCCSSQQTSSWVVAVPAVVQQLQQPLYQLSGAAEAHGALWQLILCRDQKPSTDPTAAKLGARAGSAAAGTIAQQDTLATNQADCQMLLQLLEMVADAAQQLQRQVILLQLMADAQKAAGKQRLWDDTVTTAVKQMAARLKQLQTPKAQANPASIVDAVDSVAIVEGGTAGADSISANGTTDTCYNDSRGLQKLQRQSSAAARDSIDHRQLQQLCLTALKLAKEVLTQGGKSD